MMKKMIIILKFHKMHKNKSKIYKNLFIYWHLCFRANIKIYSNFIKDILLFNLLLIYMNNYKGF